MASPSRITLITGGSRGLGRHAALAVAADGSDVILTYHSRAGEAADVVAQIEARGRRALALPLDVADAASFTAFAAQVRQALAGWQCDRLSALLNNAGIGLHAAFADTTPEQFDLMVAIHLKAPYFLTQALLPLFADGARILNVSSGLARFSLPGYSAYATMKGGVEVFSRYLAAELGPRGISVNTIAPGAIATDFSGGAVRDNPQVNAMVAGHTALGRAGLPEDIGPVMAALLSPATAWINGQRVEASGGMFV